MYTNRKHNCTHIGNVRIQRTNDKGVTGRVGRTRKNQTLVPRYVWQCHKKHRTVKIYESVSVIISCRLFAAFYTTHDCLERLHNLCKVNSKCEEAWVDSYAGQ